MIDPEAVWLRLTYTASGNPMDYRVPLVTTQPTYGGRRWWFMCPLAIHGRCPASARGEALPAAGREVFWKPRGVPAHLHVMPGEREIRRALSPTGCEYGDGSGIYQARTEAALGVSRKCKTFLMAAQPQRADLFCRSRNRRDGPTADISSSSTTHYVLSKTFADPVWLIAVHQTQTNSVRHGSLIASFGGGAVIGALGGLIGLGGAEFRLPLLIGAFRFAALEAVILNKAMSLVVVTSALPFRAGTVPFSESPTHWPMIVDLLAGSLLGAWVGAGGRSA